MTGFFNQLTLF